MEDRAPPMTSQNVLSAKNVSKKSFFESVKE